MLLRRFDLCTLCSIAMRFDILILTPAYDMVSVRSLGMLDDYCQIDRTIAANYRVPYLDIRGSLQRAIPWWRLWYAGYVTKTVSTPMRGALSSWQKYFRSSSCNGSKHTTPPLLLKTTQHPQHLPLLTNWTTRPYSSRQDNGTNTRPSHIVLFTLVHD